MRNKTNLDERQLWQRGNVFKHAFVFLIVALALEALCKSFGKSLCLALCESIVPDHLSKFCHGNLLLYCG